MKYNNPDDSIQTYGHEFMISFLSLTTATGSALGCESDILGAFAACECNGLGQ